MKQTTILFFALMLLLGCDETSKKPTEINNHSITDADMKTTKFRKLMVNGINIAYREAGNPEKPALVLLHGYPASSHQYRKVLDQLSDDYHLIAPDYPGFGDSDFPAPDQYEYTFDHIANTIDDFLDKKGLNSYAIVMQDYGAPVGFRIATKHPERVTAIITQTEMLMKKASVKDGNL